MMKKVNNFYILKGRWLRWQFQPESYTKFWYLHTIISIRSSWSYYIIKQWFCLWVSLIVITLGVGQRWAYLMGAASMDISLISTTIIWLYPLYPSYLYFYILVLHMCYVGLWFSLTRKLKMFLKCWVLSKVKKDIYLYIFCIQHSTLNFDCLSPFKS